MMPPLPRPLPLPIRLFPAPHRARLSTRASAVLGALDLPPAGPDAALPGVYDGEWKGAGAVLESVCPATREPLARVRSGTPAELHGALARARAAARSFRHVPAPRRGEVLRQIRTALADKRAALGALVSLEMGKIRTEGVGEVQEFVDICDYAVGLARAMHGRVVASERPGHSIMEVPNPLGVVAVLSAFNFPVAVYGWNLALSFAAGNATLWKPAPSTPLCSIAVAKIVGGVLERNGLPGALAGLVVGGRDAGAALVESEHVDLVSFTGSEAVGRQVGRAVQARFGKVILELGGNNAAIVLPDADLGLAVPAVFFGAVGTAGQRCTSTRRLYLHRAIAGEFLGRLLALYGTLRPGDPLAASTVLGPMHSAAGAATHARAVAALRAAGAEILAGGEAGYAPAELAGALAGGFFVRPTIARPRDAAPARAETFAPVLHVAEFDALEDAIARNNAVPQGLSSSLWTRDVRSVGHWLGPAGSDCGIVNVNVGTSGAEIGAAFGGNKSTGWGREAGGDAWRQYVRWSACTVNFSDAAPLAQGVTFAA